MKKYNLAQWNLSNVKPANIKKEMQEIERKTKLLEKKRALLNNSITTKQFINLVKLFEDLTKQTTKLSVYTYLHFCEDSSNQKALAEMSQVKTFLTGVGNRLLFFGLWFKSLPEKKAQQLIKAGAKYHYHFEFIRKTKPYTLKENEEKIINLKDSSGVSVLNNIYSIFTSQFEFEFDGKKMTQEELTSFVRDVSPKRREEAYRALFVPFIKHKNILGEIYQAIINDWREESIGLRGYKDPINVRNVANDIPDQAVDILLKVCQKNEYLFRKFLQIKRKKLGLKKLRRFDLYAPIKEEKDKISYNKAVELVLQSFAQFSPQFYNAAKSIIDANQVHSQLQKNKRSGAFCCPASTDLKPYLLLNYTGKLRDVSTLAHELGHGVHFILASGQSEYTYDACLPLAETASIFSEMLLSEQLLKDDPKKAKEMMFAKVDDLYASIIRQAGFVNFEKKAHQMIKEGKTVDEMSQVYLHDLRRQLGIEVDDVFAYEWTYVPHIFHTPFYCYAYAFGNLFTLALYKMYKKEGDVFVPKFLEMLAKGGSESPLEITKAMGVDICSEKFWQKGFDVVKKMIKELEC